MRDIYKPSQYFEKGKNSSIYVISKTENADNNQNNIHSKITKVGNTTIDHRNEKAELFSEDSIPVNDGNIILPQRIMMNSNFLALVTLIFLVTKPLLITLLYLDIKNDSFRFIPVESTKFP